MGAVVGAAVGDAVGAAVGAVVGAVVGAAVCVNEERGNHHLCECVAVTQCSSYNHYQCSSFKVRNSQNCSS